MKRDNVLAIFAWYVDVVIIECLIWPIHNLYNQNDGILYHLSVLIRLILFVLSILYHVKWKNRTHWLSPGEYITGQRLMSGQKGAVRMYSIHRTFMFSVILINLLCTTKSLEMSFYGLENTWIILLISYCFNFLILIGAYKLSEVKVSGIIYSGLAMGFMVGNHAVDYFSFNIQTSRNMFIFYLILLLANVGVYQYYKSRRIEVQNSILENSMQVN